MSLVENDDDDGIFLFPPGNKINPANTRCEKREFGIPFLHAPTPPVLLPNSDEDAQDLPLKQMIKKPNASAPAASNPEPMQLVDEDEDVLPNPSQQKRAAVARKRPAEDEEEDSDEEGDGAAESIGEEDEEEEGEDDEDDEEEAGGQLSKFAQTVVGMKKKDADEWAENFVSDGLGELDDKAQGLIVLIAEHYLRVISNKKTPFIEQASEISRQVLKDLNEAKRGLIDSI